MVQFDVQVDHKLRKANNARLLEQRVCSDLPDTLRGAQPGGAGPNESRTGNVIPFRAQPPSVFCDSLAKKA
jgi:hypothetical protein